MASVDREGSAKLALVEVPLDHAYAKPSGACYCFRIFSEMHDKEAITIQGAIGVPRATVSEQSRQPARPLTAFHHLRHSPAGLATEQRS